MSTEFIPCQPFIPKGLAVIPSPGSHFLKNAPNGETKVKEETCSELEHSPQGSVQKLQNRRTWLWLSQIPAAPSPPRPSRMIEQTALNHPVGEEAWSSPEGLRLAPEKAARRVWLPDPTLAAGPAVDAAEFKGATSLGATSRTGVMKESSDLLTVRMEPPLYCVRVCVCAEFFLSLLCFHALDVEYLKTIIGNSLSPTARGWNLAQPGGEDAFPQ